jgi:hypothetical protein
MASEKILRRQVRSAESYCAANDTRLHFGLGPATTLDAVQVTWSDGTTEMFDALACDKFHTLKRGEGRGE